MKSDFAQPTTSLLEIWREWVDLHRQLKVRSLPVVPPFLSAASGKQTRKPIMVVGKATDGKWDSDSYESQADESDRLILNRLDLNRRIVLWENNGGAFWRFFKMLSDVNGGAANVIWSNVAKIGCPDKNPSGDVLAGQAMLAQRTLRTEIEQYRPALVVFTTHMFANELINEALGTSDETWTKSKEDDADDNVWWIEEIPEFSKTRFLWARHPQSKGRATIAFWVAKAEELLAS